MTKRLMSSFLAMFLAIVMVPVVNTKAASVKEVYNREAALQYASEHWNDGKGLCAEFVSDCLKAGGLIKTYQRRVVNLYNALVKNDCGRVYKLTLKDDSIPVGPNVDKIKAGDPIFFFCNNCEEFTHVSLCSGYGSKGYVLEYAHNQAKNNTRVYTYSHCGSFNLTLYSINMYDAQTLLEAQKAEEEKSKEPQIITTINLDGGVYFRWEATENTSYYRVYRKTNKSGWKFLANTTNTVYTDKTAKNGVKYTYTVRACNGSLFGTNYPNTQTTYLGVVKFKSIKNINNAIAIEWNCNEKADGYYIYRQENNGNWHKIKTIKDNDTLSYTDKNVKSGNVYNYRIRAFIGDITSTYDVEGATVRCLFAPQIKNVLNVNDGIRIDFAGVKGANGYRIYRKAAGEKVWSSIGTTNKNSYTDKTVENGVYYRYTVRSVRGKISGSFDSKGLVIKCISTPEITGVSYKNDMVRLSWEPVEGAEGYFVYNRPEGSSKWKRVAVLKDATAYCDSTPEEGSTYYYTVKAFYGDTVSDFKKTGLKCVCEEQNNNETEKLSKRLFSKVK